MKNKSAIKVIIFLGIAAVLISAGVKSTVREERESPSPTVTEEPVRSPEPTPAPTPASTPTPTPTPESTPEVVLCPYSVPLNSEIWEAENRLEIPELQYVVPITDCQVWEAQGYCDMESMAAAFIATDTLCIADHNNQGFSVIKYCWEGITCRLIRGENVAEYTCVLIDTEAHNTGPLIVFKNGESAESAGYDLMMYTCNDCWQNITLVMWNYSGEANPTTDSEAGDAECQRPRV